MVRQRPCRACVAEAGLEWFRLQAISDGRGRFGLRSAPEARQGLGASIGSDGKASAVLSLRGRARAWFRHGSEPSATVRRLLDPDPVPEAGPISGGLQPAATAKRLIHPGFCGRAGRRFGRPSTGSDGEAKDPVGRASPGSSLALGRLQASSDREAAGWPWSTLWIPQPLPGRGSVVFAPATTVGDEPSGRGSLARLRSDPPTARPCGLARGAVASAGSPRKAAAPGGAPAQGAAPARWPTQATQPAGSPADSVIAQTPPSSVFLSLPVVGLPLSGCGHRPVLRNARPGRCSLRCVVLGGRSSIFGSGLWPGARGRCRVPRLRGPVAHTGQGGPTGHSPTRTPLKGVRRRQWHQGGTERAGPPVEAWSSRHRRCEGVSGQRLMS
jgi:hypothetical protein